MSDVQKNRVEYMARVNRVLDYIETHMDENLTLDELAQIACFSKYHFHRVFSSTIGETLYQFIKRVRLERAASLLGTSSKSLTEIALELGFESHAAFSRSFKLHFGVSPSAFRDNPVGVKNLGAGGSLQMSGGDSNFEQAIGKNRLDDGNGGEAFRLSSVDIEPTNNNPIWRFKMQDQKRNVIIENFADIKVAYVRHMGPYKGDLHLFEQLYKKMFAFAGPRGLITPNMRSYIVYHDDPDITDEARLRTSVCFPVPDSTKGEGEVGIMTIPKGRYATCHFEISVEQYAQCWEWMYGKWLPMSGFEPDDRPCFERYVHQGEADCDGQCKVDICIPVKPAGQ